MSPVHIHSKYQLMRVCRLPITVLVISHLLLQYNSTGSKLPLPVDGAELGAFLDLYNAFSASTKKFDAALTYHNPINSSRMPLLGKTLQIHSPAAVERSLEINDQQQRHKFFDTYSAETVEAARRVLQKDR